MISQIKGSRLILSDIVVFIFVLAALACVASPHFKRVKERRYTLNAKAKLKTIYEAQISYYRLNSRYADSLDELAVIDPKVDEGLSDMTGGRKSDRDWNYYIVLVGGAPLNEAFSENIGADAYCRDAAVAVETAKEWMSRRQGSALAAG